MQAAGARFRQRLKEDPERNEVYLEKKRQYYHAHKNDKVLTQREIDKQKKYKTQKKREWRLRQKQAEAEKGGSIAPKKVTKRVGQCYKN